MEEHRTRAIASLALEKQGLSRRPARADKTAILDLVTRIGLLQLDSASVVDRSHYLVLLSRLGLYDRATVDQLVYPDSQLIEQWAHCASLLPLTDLGHFAPVFKSRTKEPISKRKRIALGGEPEEYLERVYDHVARSGPCMARDFNDQTDGPKKWWSRKPSRIALDLLAYRGRLTVERRIGFQCSYNLTDRVLGKAFQRVPAGSLPAFYHWVVRRSLGCMGAGTAAQIADYYRQPVRPVRQALATLIEAGDVQELSVDGWKQPAYVLSEDRSLLDSLATQDCSNSVTCLLSPFDNLIWHRQRTLQLFGIEFKNEMYTPLKERARVYGYYVMAILHKGKIIGRVDPKVDRKSSTLNVNSLHISESFRFLDDDAQAVARALAELATFCGCNSIRFASEARHHFDRQVFEELSLALEE